MIILREEGAHIYTHITTEDGPVLPDSRETVSHSYRGNTTVKFYTLDLKKKMMKPEIRRCQVTPELSSERDDFNFLVPILAGRP